MKTIGFFGVHYFQTHPYAIINDPFPKSKMVHDWNMDDGVPCQSTFGVRLQDQGVRRQPTAGEMSNGMCIVYHDVNKHML